MMTVRFPNGQAVHYHNVNYATWLDSPLPSLLYDKDPREGGILIAKVPAECIIEWGSPERVYNGIQSSQETDIAKELRLIKKRLDKALKEK